MEKQQTTYQLSHCVPEKVQTPDMNQLVVQNVDELLAVQVQIKSIRE
jgi:hypothetical protein